VEVLQRFDRGGGETLAAEAEYLEIVAIKA
jgi:hypothetical protein